MRFRRTIRCFTLAGLLGVSLPAIAADEPADANSPAALFEQLDANKDGKLTKEEVGEDRARFFNRLVRVADKNEDGALTKEEFIAGSQPAERPAQPGNNFGGQRPGGQRPGGFTQEMFTRMDQNGDGKLSLKEIPEQLQDRFKPAFDRFGKDELTLQEIQRVAGGGQPGRPGNSEEFFKRIDTNGDGKLTLEEAPEPLKDSVRAMLRRLGKREDGTITMAEFRQPFFGGQPMPPGAAFGNFAGGLMRVVDTNRDGKISKAELSKAVEQFDKLDKNGDGDLDTRELSEFGGPRDPGTPAQRPNGNRNERPNVEQFVNGTLDRFDADKDGKISQKEMADMPERGKERLAKWDANKDGELTKEELTTGAKADFNQFPKAGEQPRSDRPRPQRPKTDN